VDSEDFTAQLISEVNLNIPMLLVAVLLIWRTRGRLGLPTVTPSNAAPPNDVRPHPAVIRQFLTAGNGSQGRFRWTEMPPDPLEP